MNLFRQHAKKNEQFAKEAMLNVAKRVIGKHTIAQEMLNQILSGGQTKGDGPCLECKIDKLTKVMAKLDNQYGEISKTYELMFGVQLDSAAIIRESLEEFYPLTSDGIKEDKSERMEGIKDMFRTMFGGDDDDSHHDGNDDQNGEYMSNGVHIEGMPSDAPQDVKNVINAVTGALSKMGKNKKDFTVGVIDISKNSTHGLHPEDFKNFDEFREAVIAARNKSKVPGEVVINEAVMHKAEEDAASATTDEKPKRKRKADVQEEKKPKLN